MPVPAELETESKHVTATQVLHKKIKILFHSPCAHIPAPTQASETDLDPLSLPRAKLSIFQQNQLLDRFLSQKQSMQQSQRAHNSAINTKTTMHKLRIKELGLA